jgi:hypothetical protein
VEVHVTRFRNRLGFVVLIVALVIAAAAVHAQVSRPWRNGSVWDIGFVRIKPGMEASYFRYLASDWKRQQDAAKQEGLILSYRLILTEPHDANDWNMMLMTEYKDLASMEAAQDKTAALFERLMGEQKIRAGYKERMEIREVLGNRLAREILLEPAK